MDSRVSEQIDRREFLHMECDCVPDLGPAHCHRCSQTDPSGKVHEWPCYYADAMAQFLAEVRAEARRETLIKAADFVNEQRYEDNADDLRQVRDRIRALADKEQGDGHHV